MASQDDPLRSGLSKNPRFGSMDLEATTYHKKNEGPKIARSHPHISRYEDFRFVSISENIPRSPVTIRAGSRAASKCAALALGICCVGLRGPWGSQASPAGRRWFGECDTLPSGNDCQSCWWHIEIVDLPNFNMVIFHHVNHVVLVYQRVPVQTRSCSIVTGSKYQSSI